MNCAWIIHCLCMDCAKAIHVHRLFVDFVGTVHGLYSTCICFLALIKDFVNLSAFL